MQNLIEVVKIGKYTLEGKTEQLDFKKIVSAIYWESARSKYTKMELKYHSFKENLEILWKSFLKIFFGLESSKNRIFKTCGILRKSQKNRKISKIEPGRPGMLRNRSETIFFWTLGGPCGQNESYTNSVRPFFMMLYNSEVGPLLTDFPEILFSSICVHMTWVIKNY